MKILWLTWKDMQNPQAGGAEVVNEELAKRLVQDGHEVLFVVGGYHNSESEELRDGFKIVRVGGRYTVFLYAYRYYRRNLRGWADLVIDEVNTVPFFAKYYVQEKNILFVHQLARQIWFYQMFFPLSLIGYLLEPLYLRLLRDRETITVSKSTQTDLLRHGFKEKNVHIIHEGIEIEPVPDLSIIQKYETPTLLSLGAVRPMKRTLDIVRAFEFAKKNLPSLTLIIAGDNSGAYGATTLHHISHSPYKNDIRVLGRISKEKKVELLQKCHILAVTSVKEGWGLVVTEANSQGTPAVVYNVDGLRDSVRHKETGLITTRNTPDALTATIRELLTAPELYQSVRQNAWEWSKTFTFDRAYEDFKVIVSSKSRLYSNNKTT